ncbi:MAG: MBL fold metallo-hydrolase [Polyangiaceae bacterium]
MKVHHLKCGEIRGLAVNGRHLVCHCLLVETEASGLVLVDAGLGAQDLVDPVPRLGAAFTYGFARPSRDPSLSALAQVKALGFAPEDVRHVVVTHMDLDHVGGLVDFPHAAVHVHAIEHRTAMAPPTYKERERYRAPMWAHGPRFETYDEAGEPWFGFEAVRGLRGLPPDVLLVPLVGHTRGHTAVALRGPRGWMLHAGDAYFDHGEVHRPTRECPFLLRVFQTAAEMRRADRLANQDRLRALLSTESSIECFCAHDPHEFLAAQAREISGGVNGAAAPSRSTRP